MIDIKATMTVDRGKPKDIVLEVGNIIGEGSDIDYVLKLHYFPSLRYAETFDIKFQSCLSHGRYEFYYRRNV